MPAVYDDAYFVGVKARKEARRPRGQAGDDAIEARQLQGLDWNARRTPALVPSVASSARRRMIQNDGE
jgi:hypothetical protein